MLLAGERGSTYRQIVLGHAIPSGMDSGMIVLPQKVKAPETTRREGVVGVIDAAVIHVTSLRTDANRHYPRTPGTVTFDTALETEMRRAYGGGGLIFEEVKPYMPLAEISAVQERIINSTGDPDPERELFNVAKKTLLERARDIYPAHFPQEKESMVDRGIDVGGHISDVDSDAKFRQALNERISARKKRNSI